MTNPASPEACRRLIEAGVTGDSPAFLIEDGELVLVKWDQFQSPGAARMREHRHKDDDPELPLGDADKPVCDAQTPEVTHEEPTGVTKPVSDAQKAFVRTPCHVTQTQTENKQEVKESLVVVPGGVGGLDHHHDPPSGIPDDPLLAEFIALARTVPKFKRCTLDARLALEVLERARRLAPSEPALSLELSLWQRANAGKFSKGETDPVAALAKWMEKKSIDWQKVRKRTERRKPEERVDYVWRIVDEVGKRFIPGTDREFNEQAWMAEQGVFA
jgi:hypothetical protein